MPNIQTKDLVLKDLPFVEGDYEFLFLASTKDKKESLVLTRYQDKNFFLKIIKREDDYLIKHDKLTRLSPISIIQNGLKAFSKAHKLELTFSNIETKKSQTHFQKSSEYLKNIEYFIDRDFDKEVWIEVGFGSGRHLLHQAKKHPNIDFIGIEIHSPSIEQLIKQCKLQEITNIKIVKFDARVFLQLLPSNLVGKIFVHFPVPWDKKPHRRVISKEFIDEASRVLKVGGNIELRTDSDNYYEYSYNLFNSLNSFELMIRKNRDIEVSSKYEDRWKRLQKNIYDITYTNSIKSPQRERIDLFEFKRYLPFKEAVQKLPKDPIRGDDFFVHFTKAYFIDEKSGVLELSFGSFTMCEHKYLIFNDNKIQYFPHQALPIEQNLKSHKKIEELIYG